MDTADQPTCGKGLAENSVFPATLSHLIAAMAENLAMHMKALDLTDPNSQTEHGAYEISSRNCGKPRSNYSGPRTRCLDTETYPWAGMIKLP
jgi:hypothetical protein